MKAFKPFRWALAISSLGLLLANSVRWVLAQSVQGLYAPQRNSPPLMQVTNWDSTSALLREAFRISVNEWVGRARIQGGNVNASAAILTPGSLTSDVNIYARMIEILSAWRMQSEVSTAGARVLASAWSDWARDFQMYIPAAYPSFSAVPAPAAPPTPSMVSPALSLGRSAGEASLNAQVLSSRLISAMRPNALKVSGGMPDQAMFNLASWVDSSFTQWKNAVTVSGLIGSGPVPTYAPPYVPVGPVLSGVNVSASSPFVGPRFGIAVP